MRLYLWVRQKVCEPLGNLPLMQLAALQQILLLTIAGGYAYVGTGNGTNKTIS